MEEYLLRVDLPELYLCKDDLLCRSIFEKRLFTEFLNTTDRIEIGRGGAGNVYYLPDYQEYAFKISKNSCRKWEIEYKKTIDIQNNMPSLDLVKFATVINYQLFDNMCVMQMLRVFNPDKKDFALHTLFGEESKDVFFPGRGRFIGYQQILEYLENIQEYISQLGIFMSLLHYKAKYDGYDLEIILGDKILYVIDFDLSEKITTFDVQRLVDSLTLVEYFPSPSTPHYNLFKTAYLENSGDHLEIAKQVIDLYEEWFS